MKSNTEKLVGGISTQTLVTISLGIIEMGYFATMSRLLTRSDFGYYAALTGVMSIFLSISEAGLGASIIQKKNVTNSYISTAFSMSVILGLIMSFVIFLCAPFLANIIADETLKIPFRVMAFTIIPYCLTSVGNAVLYKKLDFKHVGVISVISYFLSSVVAIICAINGMGLSAVIIYSVMIPFINCIFIYVLFVDIPKLELNKFHLSEIFFFGGWLTLSTLINNITHQIDKLMLPKLLSVQTLGAYNRPAGFITTISSKINSIFDSVLFPMLSGIQDDRVKTKSVLYRSVELLNSLSIIFAALFFLNSKTIIVVFFGQAWMELVSILQILSLSLIFNIDNRLVDCFFRSLAMVKQSFFLRNVGFCITFGAIVISSGFGLTAVAWGIVLSNVFTIYIKMFYLCYRIKVSISRILVIWMASWKSILPLAILWLLFSSLTDNNYLNIAFIFFQIIILICQFCFYPQSIGPEYKKSIYPIIKNKYLKKQ